MIGLNPRANANGMPVPGIIFDTDMATDAGDAGAMAVVCALALAGECVLLACGCPGTYNFSPGCTSAMLTYYGLGDVEVGVNKGSTLEPGPDPTVFNQAIVAGFPNNYPTAASAPNAVTLYRQKLAAAPDGTVKIITVGFLSNISNLFDSLGDAISPLTGAQLMAAKVNEVVIMGGDYTTGNEYNFNQAPSFAANFVNNYTGKMRFVGFTIGNSVLTGQRVIDETPASNPVREAFVLFKAANPTLVPRESWDQIAVLWAIRGKDWQSQAYISQTSLGTNTVNPSTGANSFASTPANDQRYALPQMAGASLATVIDDIQVRAP